MIWILLAFIIGGSAGFMLAILLSSGAIADLERQLNLWKSRYLAVIKEKGEA